MAHLDKIPFPVLDPPRANHILGAILIFMGAVTMIATILVGGLTGVGIVAFLYISYLLITGDQSTFLLSSSHLLTPIVMSLLGIPIPISVNRFCSCRGRIA